MLVPRADCDSESDNEECDEGCEEYAAGTRSDSFSDVGELPDTEVSRAVLIVSREGCTLQSVMDPEEGVCQLAIHAAIELAYHTFV